MNTIKFKPNFERVPVVGAGHVAAERARMLTSELDTDARLHEAWLGINLYSDFLRRNCRRPSPSEAATIGLLMGTKVRDCHLQLRPDLHAVLHHSKLDCYRSDKNRPIKAKAQADTKMNPIAVSVFQNDVKEKYERLDYVTNRFRLLRLVE